MGKNDTNKTTAQRRKHSRSRDNPREVYQDVDSGYSIYVGMNGRTHVFTADGRHHTSLTFPIYAFGLCSCGFLAHPL